MVGGDIQVVSRGRKLPEVLADCKFQRSSSWTLTGTGITIADGRLVLKNALTVKAVAQVKESVQINQRYVYKVVVDVFDTGVGATITVGGNELWNQDKRAGVFRGEFTARTTEMLTFRAAAANGLISFISVQRLSR